MSQKKSFVRVKSFSVFAVVWAYTATVFFGVMLPAPIALAWFALSGVLSIYLFFLRCENCNCRVFFDDENSTLPSIELLIPPKNCHGCGIGRD